VFLRNSARPAASQNVFQWLGLSNTDKRFAKDGLDEFEHTQSHFSVGPHPVAQILSKLGMKYSFPLSVARQDPSRGAVSLMAPVVPCGSLRAPAR